MPGVTSAVEMVRVPLLEINCFTMVPDVLTNDAVKWLCPATKISYSFEPLGVIITDSLILSNTFSIEVIEIAFLIPAYASSLPAPQPKPCTVGSAAVSMAICFTSLNVRLGFADSQRAATPAMWGVACDVPEQEHQLYFFCAAVV